MSILINLLPEAHLIKVKNQVRKRTYTSLAGIIAAAIATILITLALFLGYLVATHSANSTKINELNVAIAKNNDLEQSSATLQSNLDAFSKQNENRTHASLILTNLYQVIPKENILNISIVGSTQTTAPSSDVRVTISGITTSFLEVARYQEKLRDFNINYLRQPGLDREAIFTNVRIDLVNRTTDPNVVDFSLSFDVKQDQIKKQVGVRK